MALDIADRYTAVSEEEIAELQRLTAQSTPIFELAA
jgi:hypothetical protein